MALTPREREVLELVAEGLTNREIGERLCVTAKQVAWHLTHILAELGVTNRTAAARVVWQERAAAQAHEIAALRAQIMTINPDVRSLAHYAQAVARTLEPLCNGAY